MLKTEDNEIFQAIEEERARQQYQIELIASENIVSQAVLEATGSILTNKYAEGYPGKRYYGGCEFVDKVEQLAIDRAKKLFNAGFANVQPHSGSSANLAVFMALLMPGDTIMGMDLAAGGHLTHGAPVSFSGKWFKSVSYGVHPETMLMDYDALQQLALAHKPKMIIAGWSAYSRILDFKKFRAIADSIGAYLFVDMAHFAGLVAAGLHPNPLEHAHVVTSTTHKTLRGPRGGLILTNDEVIAKKINTAIFPATQGGPLMHVIAAKAVAFKEALQPAFKHYCTQVIKNAQTLAVALQKAGFSIISGGTDTHVMLVDLRPYKVTGNNAEQALEQAGLTCNKNAIPNDPEKYTITSGIRLGTPAITTRGFKEPEVLQVAGAIITVLAALRDGVYTPELQEKIKSEMHNLCAKFPI